MLGKINLKNGILSAVFLGLAFMFAKSVFAVEADAMLEMRDRCNEGMTCPQAEETEQKTTSRLNHRQ